MEKVCLNSSEFLSLYTGIQVADSIQVVDDAIKRIFELDENPGMLTRIAYATQFKNYIDKNNPELAKQVELFGTFKKPENGDVFKAIKEYCKKFEAFTKTKDFYVDKMEYDENFEFEFEPIDEF